MKRGASIAVLSVFLAGLLVPLIQLVAPTLPACCRANGAHHCSEMAHTGADGFRSQGQICPFRTFPAVTGGVVALPKVGATYSLPVAQTSLRISLLVDPDRLSFDTVQKRGPPQS